MADCTNPNEQQISGAFPNESGTNTGSVKVNTDQNPQSIFNPNIALAAVQTYNTFNYVVNEMLGIDARWFRAVPQQRSKDVIFQEYTLSCVEDTPICLKVIMAGGNMPESKYGFDLMGLEYELPTEIQIDKKYWEKMAGFGTAPQKKDIVYLPLPNRLYQVESSFLKRGFMEQETTWVCNLRKYQPEASRREGPNLKETIDQYVVSEEELFGEAIQKEVDKLTNDKQFSPFNSTVKDFYKILDKKLLTIPYNLDIHGIIAAQSVYDMKTPEFYNAVEYKDSSDRITVNDDRAITAWIMPRTIDQTEYDVEWIQYDASLVIPKANYKIKIKGIKRFQIGDTFTIYRSGVLNFYATILDDSNANTGIYFCIIDQPVINYLNSLNPNWSTARNYKMKVQEPISILDGINGTDNGFEAWVYANQYVKVVYANQLYVAPITEKLLDNSWYGIVINIGNTWKQYNVSIWKPSTNPSEKLQNIYSQTIQFKPEYIEVEKYTLNRSDSYMTNIRLFKTTIEEERQVTELLSYITKDSDQAIILDNADLKFMAPYISRQR